MKKKLKIHFNSCWWCLLCQIVLLYTQLKRFATGCYLSGKWINVCSCIYIGTPKILTDQVFNCPKLMQRNKKLSLSTLPLKNKSTFFLQLSKNKILNWTLRNFINYWGNESKVNLKLKSRYNYMPQDSKLMFFFCSKLTAKKY